MSYWRLYYHVVWATKNRLPLLTPDIEPVVHRILIAKGKELGALVYAVNGTYDHVHIAASVPPRVSLADWVRRLKGSSSRIINIEFGDGTLKWQQGYGIMSFGSRQLKWVIEYIKRQKEHHQTGSLVESLEFETDGVDAPPGA